MRHSYFLPLALLLAACPGTALLAQTAPTAPTAAAPAAATGSLTGTVLDSVAGKPVAYATVVLLPAAPATPEKALTGVAADGDGQFVIAKLTAGPYRLRVSYVGYGPQTRAVTVGSGPTAVPAFRLPAAATALAEAVVIGSKPGVEDRTSVV